MDLCYWGQQSFTFLKIDCLVRRLGEVSSQGISAPARKAECKVDIPSVVCGIFRNKLIRVNVTEISYKGDSNSNLFTVNRCLVDGWKFSGNSDHVEVPKGGIKIRFDVVI